MSHLWEKEKAGAKEKKKKHTHTHTKQTKTKTGRREKGNRKGGKEKKKSSAGFKPVRLVLLVVRSVQREGVVGRSGFTFLSSWVTLFAVL